MTSIFAIFSFRKYTITLYTPEHLEIIWELVLAKKSADILSFCNSFITISIKGAVKRNLNKGQFTNYVYKIR